MRFEWTNMNGAVEFKGRIECDLIITGHDSSYKYATNK